jgi:uncharacterized protein
MSGDEQIDTIRAIVALNGGRMVGRTRLQKTAYLLKRLGAEVPFDFEYHHYGPFSAELAEALDAASEERLITETYGIGYHQSPYSIITTDARSPERLGGVPAEEATDWLRTLNGYTGTDLELAATLVFLRDEEGVTEENLEDELAALKPVKATRDRIARAWRVLESLDLD